MQLLIDENLSPRLARWACEHGYPAEAAVHVGDFMTLAAGIEVHPGVIALREAELKAQVQWLRLQAALAFAEQHCGGDLLNRVLEVQADGLFALHMIPNFRQPAPQPLNTDRVDLPRLPERPRPDP